MSIKYEKLFSSELKNLEFKIEKLNKKAKKIGVPEMAINIIDKRDVTFHTSPWTGDEYTIPRVFCIYDVEVIGETPKYEGWEFLATVVGYPDGRNMLKRNPFSSLDVDITKYRNEKSYCDHCKTKRYRKNTYLIYNLKEEKIYQVGSTCIKDYLGHDIGNVYNTFVKMYGEVEDFDMMGNGPKPIPMIYIKGYLPLLCEIIKTFGFTSKKKAWETGALATAEFVWQVEKGMNGDKTFIEYRDFTISEDSKKLAENIYEWGRNLKNRENLSDYFYSLSLIFDNDKFDTKSEGLVCSCVFAYKKDTEQLEERKNKKPSEYVGEIKKRQEFIVTLNKVFEFSSNFGVTYMHLFNDENDNKLVWYGSDYIRINKEGVVNDGDKIKIKATVKYHKEYKGEKQTIITRATGIDYIKGN